MTVTRRIIVGIGDIKAITVECNRCHIRMTFSPDAPSFLGNCPNQSCNAVWLPTHYANETPPLTIPNSRLPMQVRLLQAIADIRRKAEEDKVERPKEPIGFSVFWEFEEPK
jgi:hypothetical protein